jgi:type VI secretion system protein ImpE
MTALSLYREGKLRDAISALGQEVRSNPLDAERRTFLFELLLFGGEYDRAEKHLDLLAGAGANAAAGSLLYRSALHAERTRQSMFRNGELPPAGESLSQAGVCDGKPFNELTDADPRIGANLEVFLAGSYTWIPMRYVARVEMQPPANLRDLIWINARLETTSGFPIQDIGEVLLPAMAPLSSTHPEEVIQLGRECAWEPDQRYGEIPFGAKTFLIDGEERPLLGLRTIEWNSPAKEPQDAAS